MTPTPGAGPSSLPQGQGPIAEVSLEGRVVRFYIPNDVARWRSQTILSKEPWTINWLRELRPNDVLIDVGANVGTYSVFAAAVQGARVFAFEPESQNFSLLVKNIYLNKLHDRVIAYPAALSNVSRLDRLYLSDFAWDGAGSLHSFAADVGHDLKPRRSPFSQGCISISLDEAVQSGAIPIPRFIKIDVDGMEHLVVAGGMRTFADPRVESLCIELNTHLPQHRAILDTLAKLGFASDPEQLKQSMRREGPFEGCGEFIFRKSLAIRLSVVTPLSTVDVIDKEKGRDLGVVQHVLNKIETTPIEVDPFPYAVIDGIFPSDYYLEMLRRFPAPKLLKPLSETGRTSGDAYRERMVLLFDDISLKSLPESDRCFWSGLAAWLYSEQFISAVLRRFLPWCEERLRQAKNSAGSVAVRSDAMLVSDRTRYAIGPHTDAPHRLISFLFYLPSDTKDEDLGTSIYRAKDPSFVCRGGPHYPFEAFNRTGTVPFIPNRLMMFVRTGRSFHGVEPINREGVDRRLLINNIRLV